MPSTAPIMELLGCWTSLSTCTLPGQIICTASNCTHRKHYQHAAELVYSARADICYTPRWSQTAICNKRYWQGSRLQRLHCTPRDRGMRPAPNTERDTDTQQVPVWRTPGYMMMPSSLIDRPLCNPTTSISLASGHTPRSSCACGAHTCLFMLEDVLCSYEFPKTHQHPSVLIQCTVIPTFMIQSTSDGQRFYQLDHCDHNAHE